MQIDINDFLDSKDAIYHFTTKEKALEFILNDKELKLGTFSKTNDPQEYKTKLVSTLGETDDFKKKKVEVTAQIDNIIKSSGFLSFCENSYDETIVKQHGYKKARMWSHYSSNHTGICLVFSKRKIIEKLHKVFDDKSIVYSGSIKYFENINHHETLPPLIIGQKELKENNTRDLALNYLKTNYEKILFQKQWDYEGENEFRIILVPKTDEMISGMVFNIYDCLELVILGDSFHNVYIPAVEVLSKDLKIPFKKLYWEHNQFFLHDN